MEDQIREFVRLRAQRRCEYCRLPEHQAISVPFHIEHIRAKQHQGSDDVENLAYACQQCNLYKGPNQSGYDPATNLLVRLFHPRLDNWDSHFTREGPFIIGQTPEGRATVELLLMNSRDYVELRDLIGEHHDVA